MSPCVGQFIALLLLGLHNKRYGRERYAWPPGSGSVVSGKPSRRVHDERHGLGCDGGGVGAYCMHALHVTSLPVINTLHLLIVEARLHNLCRAIKCASTWKRRFRNIPLLLFPHPIYYLCTTFSSSLPLATQIRGHALLVNFLDCSPVWLMNLLSVAAELNPILV